MNIETELRQIYDKIERLTQIHDFTTLQMTFLALLFGLFIFSVTAIIQEFPPIVLVISYITLFLSTMMLYFLLISIFSNNWDSKISFFIMVIFLIVIIAIYVVLSFFVFYLMKTITGDFYVNNVIIILLLLAIFVISFLFSKKILDPYFQRRFNLLYIIEKRTMDEGLYFQLERYFKKKMQRIAFSVLAGFILTFLTGFIDVAQDFQTTTKYYGWPFQWLRQPIDAKVVEFRYFEFVSDLIIMSLVIYVIISLYERYFVKEKP